MVYPIDLNVEPIITAVDHVKAPLPATSRWYTIDGRPMLSRPFLPGIYIHAGKKVLVTK